MSTDYNPLPPESLEPASPVVSVPPVRLLDPPWTIWDVLGIGVVAFVSIQLVGLLGALIATKAFHLPLEGLDRNPKLAVPVELMAYVLTLSFMIALVRSRGLPFWRTVKWQWTGNVLRYFGFGFLLAVLIGFGSALLPIPQQLPIDKYFADTAGTWMLAIFGVTVAPLMEELFFRGFLYPALARRIGLAAAVVITAFAFALIHSPQLAHAWAPLLLLFVVGVVLTLVRVRTNSVAPGFLLHSAYNLTLFIQLYFQTDHFHNFNKLGGS